MRKFLTMCLLSSSALGLAACGTASVIDDETAASSAASMSSVAAMEAVSSVASSAAAL